MTESCILHGPLLESQLSTLAETAILCYLLSAFAARLLNLGIYLVLGVTQPIFEATSPIYYFL